MEGNNLEEKYDKLQSSVQRLLEAYLKLREEYIITKRENEKLKIQVDTQNEKINDFQYKTKISKLVDYIAVENISPSELKTKIDEYIKEIDYCIEYLNKEMQ